MIAFKPISIASPIKRASHRAVGNTPKRQRLQALTWICLLVACIGTSWFSYQYFLVPQSRSFTPDWHGAQWIQAKDHTSPVTYFSYGESINALPQGAFITIAANQSFYLYINGKIIGTNSGDMTKMPRAYMYDISSSLTLGVNVLAVRVNNFDDQAPSLKLSIGIIFGAFTAYHVTGRENWKATSQSSLVYPHIGINALAWTAKKFKTTSWQLAQQVNQAPMTPMLMVNPALYEKASSGNWISGGVSNDAYFLRQVYLPPNVKNTWLRLASTGTTNVFINGSLYITKELFPLTKGGQIAYFQENATTANNTKQVTLGTYDISPYVHSGLNIIAIHLSSSGINGSQDGLATKDAALFVDMLTMNTSLSEWIEEGGWHVSHEAVPDWTIGAKETLLWPSPIIINRPAPVKNVYMSNTVLPNTTQVIPSMLIGEVVIFSITLSLSTWLLLSLPLLYFYRGVTKYRAFELTSLVFLPSLAFESVLVALSHEPQILRPFPYTTFWLSLLLAIIGISYCLLLCNAFFENKKMFWRKLSIKQYLKRIYLANWYWKRSNEGKSSRLSTIVISLFSWLSVHWLLVLIVLIAAPLIFYNLSYEPYWQDELTSYLVAKSILKTGLPYLPSGFLYPKGELFSYVLAIVMSIFGDANGVPRVVSATEYILCLPLMYYTGIYFFERRVAILATSMLAFSPLALTWGRQVRMYQQAQLLTLLTLFLFYKAIEKPRVSRYVYLAVTSLIACYLSHEETFVIMPALIVCVFMASKNKNRLLPSILYNKHWWIAGFIGAGIISVQLLIVHFSHPPLIGTDPTQRPPLQLTTDNVAYYCYLLFWPAGNNPSATGTVLTGTNTDITVNSLLALIGCIEGVISTNTRIRYCIFFFLLSFCVLVFAFTLQADRYFYPLLTVYYLLGAYGLISLFRLVTKLAYSVKQQKLSGEAPSLDNLLSLPNKLIVQFSIVITCCVVLLTPMLPFSSYNLFTSRVTNQPYYHKYVEYDDAVNYVNHHWHQGDIVISIVPDHTVEYYFKHLDYFILVDHALFLFEKQGHIVDTYTGKIGLFRQSDLQSVLNLHARVWIISSTEYYQSAVFKRFTFPPDFHIAYEGDASIVYCRGD